MEKVLGVLKVLRGISAYVTEKVYFRTSPAVHSFCTMQLKIIRQVYARDPELNVKWGTNCTPVEMLAPDILKQQLREANDKNQELSVR